MTDLCVAIFVTDAAKARRDIALAGEAGATMVELRVDNFTDAAAVASLVRDSILPCIVTCRPAWEGGTYEGTEEARLALLDEAGRAGARYIDVELEAARRGTVDARIGGDAGRIISSHDFQGRPERLYNILAQMQGSNAAVNKIVWTARTVRDNLEAFELLKTRQRPTIALCMGEAGIISRILAKKFGALLTFASLTKDTGTAPGQVSVADMKRLYRWDKIGPATRIYGVVASPVMHSMSPAIHNAAFDETGHDGVYLPLLVEGSYESFKAFMETFLNFDGLNLSGLSITIPHKENALRYLQEKGGQIEPLALAIGAVNTVVVDRTAGAIKLRGMNTDYAAILDSITTSLAINREQLADYRIAVLGAGGTGRTAVAALAHYGATVVVYNRTKERADALAAEFNGKTGRVVSTPIDKLCDSCCHIFVNTTSVGMYPKVDQSPLGDQPANFTPQTLVFDTIYNPMKTKLLQQAQAAGALTIGGIEMFVRQAAAQFSAWTGLPAPTSTMRQVIERRLSDAGR